MAFFRERRKGISVYYELVKTVRENGRVKQIVVKYFGTKKEMLDYCKRHKIKPPRFEEALLDRSTSIRLEKKLAKLNSFRPLPQNTLKSLKKKFEVEMTYNSNAIEGNRLSLKETFLVLEKGMTIGGKSVKEHLEATNHREAINMLEEIATKKRQITEKDILDLHATILDKIDPQNAGFYRHEQVYIAHAEHVPPKWTKVPELMKEVISELNSREKGAKAIESATKIHFKIAWIHPFIDGNGRLARLLTNLRLMRVGFPPLVLQKRIRHTYYNALEKADEGNLKPLAQILARDVERALDLYIDAAT
jgi:Fic family protein